MLQLVNRTKDNFIQKALELRKVKENKLKWPLLWSEKIDGVFCLACRRNGQVKIYSRTAELYTSMKHIEEIIHSILHDGEIVIYEADIPDLAHLPHNERQPITSGWCRDTKQQHPRLGAVCHTFLSLEEFCQNSSGAYSVPYIENYATLVKRFALLETSPIVTLANQHYVYNMEQAMGLTAESWQRLEEGGVLRNPLAVYQPGKRNQDIIKLKKGVSFDLEVIGMFPGKGKYTDTLGGLECRWENGGIVNISGMTDAQRDMWWNNPGEIIGKIVQVDAMCVSSKGLLREPRFRGVRTDKTKGDF